MALQRHRERLVYLSRGRVAGVTRLDGVQGAGAGAKEVNCTKRHRTHRRRRTLHVNGDRQTRRGGGAGRVGAPHHRGRWGRGGEGDRLGRGDQERLLHLGRSGVTGTARLVGVQGAGAGADEAHDAARDRADPRRSTVNADGGRETRRSDGVGRVGGATHRRSRRWRRGEGNHLGHHDGERLLHLVGGDVIGAARLIDVQGAGAGAGEAHDATRHRTDTRRSTVNADGDSQPRRGAGAGRVGGTTRRRGRRSHGAERHRLGNLSDRDRDGGRS